MYFLSLKSLTAAFSFDNSVGTLSKSIPRKSAMFVTLMSSDSGLLSDLFILKPLLGVSFRRVFPFSLQSLAFSFSRGQWLNLRS